MQTLIQLLLYTHILAGFLSLVFFIMPLIYRKGGKQHVKTGKLYVGSMWVVVVTAALLSLKNVIIGQPVMAAFLGFLALITANTLYLGIAALRQKKGMSKYRVGGLWYSFAGKRSSRADVHLRGAGLGGYSQTLGSPQE